MADDQPPVRFDSARLESVAREFGIRLIVLYGSRARRRASPQSDLDIAVLGCRAQRFRDCYQALAELFSAYSLDLVRLGEADSLLRHEILRDGVRLYGDPDLFLEYRAYAYRDFEDSADLRALEDRLFRKKMKRIEEALRGSP